jgi:hypothetical protein
MSWVIFAGEKAMTGREVASPFLCAAHPRGIEASVGPPSFPTVDEKTISA